jgi:tetratricopeptide (TPR) repeat protein
MAQERYFSAVKYFKKAYLTDQKNLTILESLGYAYNNLEYPNKSIYWIKKAIDIKPKKNLLEFLKVMYFNEKNYTKAIATQKKIFELYKYDSQGLFFIIGIYQLQNDSKNALSFLQIAYDMGYFTKEDDYLSFAYLLQSNRLYFQAAHTMSEGLKKQIVKKDTQNLRFIAQNYYEAKAYDDAIDSFKELIIIEDMSTNHIELAQIYMEHQHYEKAIDSLKKALDFKIKKELGKIELLIGINYFELKKFKEAKIHFTNAFQTSQKEDAKKWLEYLDKL